MRSMEQGFIPQCNAKSRRIFAVVLLASLSTYTSAFAESPRQVVDTLHGFLLAEIRESNSRPVPERYQRLVASMVGFFHFPFMMEKVAGAHWREATDDQRKDLVEAFTRLSLMRYASVAGSYSGGAFEVFAHEYSGPAHFVFARYVQPDATAVPIAYKFAEFEKRWGIVDVTLPGGMSELAARRSEYRRHLKRGGIVGLTKHLNAAADRLLLQGTAVMKARERENSASMGAR